MTMITLCNRPFVHFRFNSKIIAVWIIRFTWSVVCKNKICVFLYNIIYNLTLQQLEHFLFTIKISSDFNKVQIFTTYEKIMLRFVLLSITLARPGTNVKLYIILYKKTHILFLHTTDHVKRIIQNKGLKCAKGLLYQNVILEFYFLKL
jgi:hypothetical protein